MWKYCRFLRNAGRNNMRYHKVILLLSISPSYEKDHLNIIVLKIPSLKGKYSSVTFSRKMIIVTSPQENIYLMHILKKIPISYERWSYFRKYPVTDNRLFGVKICKTLKPMVFWKFFYQTTFVCIELWYLDQLWILLYVYAILHSIKWDDFSLLRIKYQKNVRYIMIIKNIIL